MSAADELLERWGLETALAGSFPPDDVFAGLIADCRASTVVDSGELVLLEAIFRCIHMAKLTRGVPSIAEEWLTTARCLVVLVQQSGVWP